MFIINVNIQNGSSLVNKVKGTFRFKITDIDSKGTKFWTLNLKDGNGSLTEGQEGNAISELLV